MEDQPPKGYLIATFTVHDQATFQQYVEAEGHLAANFNGRAILLTGKYRTPDHLIPWPNDHQLNFLYFSLSYS
ncbi:DUF1330 domain-containing protein [Dyadobacter bucti]|uniref:DUF1330 domain-containing protein n=1 Tax=Dyadobacter bucti TaxID=2572203 RepID=UPI003F703B34